MTVETRAPVDLVTRLTEAAAAAIANERQGLEYDQYRIKGIHIELEVANNGRVIEGTCYVERRVKPRRG